MGFLTGGPYYDLIGRTGNNVGRRRKGKNVFSMRPAKSSKQPTVLQLDQRTKFGLATSWMSNALSVIQIGYQHYQVNGSSMNSAVKDALDLAITGVSPNFTLDYQKVLLSKGPLLKARNLTFLSTVPDELSISWDASVGSGLSSPSDKLVVFVFSANEWLFVELIGPVTRSALTYNLSLPSEFSGNTAHIWISFVSADGKTVSKSQHKSMSLV